MLISMDRNTAVVNQAIPQFLNSTLQVLSCAILLLVCPFCGMSFGLGLARSLEGVGVGAWAVLLPCFHGPQRTTALGALADLHRRMV